MREIKSLPHHIKAIEGRAVTTLFSVAGNVDSYQDRMHLGAFAKTFQERGDKIYGLWNHDFSNLPIGTISNLKEIGREELPSDVQIQYPDAVGGAQADFTLLETPKGEDALKALKAGAPLEASFAYDSIKFDFSEEDGKTIRNLREVKLFEISLTLWGANPGTRGSKSALEIAIEHIKALLQEVKQGNRHSSNDYAIIDQIAALSVELGARNVKLLETDSNTDDTGKSDQSRAESSSLTLIQTRQRHLTSALALLGDF